MNFSDTSHAAHHRGDTVHADLGSMEDRLGARLGAALTERSLQSEHDIEARLRFAREQALERARQRRRVTQAETVSVPIRVGFSTLAWPAWPKWAGRLATMVPFVVLGVGLLAIDHGYDRAQIHATAEVDVALLADDLPVGAYRDPGFVEFLKHPQE
jgi:Protein of unknown function (DUF3619)